MQDSYQTFTAGMSNLFWQRARAVLVSWFADRTVSGMANQAPKLMFRLHSAGIIYVPAGRVTKTSLAAGRTPVVYGRVKFLHLLSVKAIQ